MSKGEIKGLSIQPNSEPVTHLQLICRWKFPCRTSHGEGGKIIQKNSRGIQRGIKNPNKLNKVPNLFFQHTSCSPKKYFSHFWIPPSYSTFKIPRGPTLDKSIQNVSWEEMLAKWEEKLTNWTHCFLTLSRRILLIKLVHNLIPLYLFSVLEAPKSFVKNIRNIQQDFLWGGVKK